MNTKDVEQLGNIVFSQLRLLGYYITILDEDETVILTGKDGAIITTKTEIQSIINNMLDYLKYRLDHIENNP